LARHFIMPTPLILFLAVIAPFLIVETIRSGYNERQLRRQGAIEPAGDPWGPIAVIYAGGFIVMALEGWARGGAPRQWMAAGLLIFTLGKLVKFWAVRTLGPRWSFRILVLPGAPLVTGGPYRYMTHPNYVGVFGEFAGSAVMLNAPVTGVVVALAFFYFLRKRIAVEERALGIR
jgi:methyltransferase